MKTFQYHFIYYIEHLEWLKTQYCGIHKTKNENENKNLWILKRAVSKLKYKIEKPYDGRKISAISKRYNLLLISLMSQDSISYFF